MKDKKSGYGRQTSEKNTKALNAIGIPPEVCGSLPVIRITGDRYVSVEHHCGILHITSTCLRLYSPAGIIRIDGARLFVQDMDGECIRLSGCIKSVKYE